MQSFHAFCVEGASSRRQDCRSENQARCPRTLQRLRGPQRAASASSGVALRGRGAARFAANHGTRKALG